MIKVKATERGFAIGNFTDSYGEKCSIQKSSAASNDFIWLGIDNPKLTVFENSQKGKYIVTEMPELFDVSARMHLSRSQVEALLPILERFVKTGDI